MNRWHRQNGMTAIGWLLVLGLIAFFALITLRMVPLYLEYAKVASALESLENEPGITRKTKPEIVKMVQKRFEVNDVMNVSTKQLVITKEEGILTVSIDYERREHLISNIDVVAKFDKKVEVVAN
jgi:regulator of protease activity HflC (stomatin/prohibitin superfamily)